MFGINLWARPFLHPAAAAAAAASSTGMEGLSHLPRHPHLSTSPYIIPGLDGKSSSVPLPPNSFFLYRPGEALLHPSMLRLDHALQTSTAATQPNGDRTLHSLHSDNDEGYPSAFVPTKRARMDLAYSSLDKSSDDMKSASERGSLDGRVGGSPMTDGRCPSTGGRSASAAGSPGLSVRSPASTDHDRHSYTEGRSPSPIDVSQPRCPVCGICLTPGEIQQHYMMEIDKFKEQCRLDDKDKENRCRQSEEHPFRPFFGHMASSVSISSSRYETFLKIKNNRHARLNAKMRVRRKRTSDPVSDDGGGHVNGDLSHPHDSHDDAHDKHNVSMDDREPEIDVTTPDPSDTCAAVDLSTSQYNHTDRYHPENNNPPRNDYLKCHICLGPYSKPVTSVQCWHVHCEDCWLKALSSKRVCPQCNMITSSSDLRKVFI